MPLISVIIPVYNRTDSLRRALRSVAAQTLTDLECLVVDDASTESVEPIVREFDERFRYLRRDTNGGCTAARLTGCAHVTGQLILSLDSDNELFPWALARGAQYLQDYPEADAAVGLFVFPDGFHVRVAEGVRLAGPEEFAARSSPLAGADSVGIYRGSLAQEWLHLRPDYFNLDLVFTLFVRLRHRVVLVDEPWGRYDPTGGDRLTVRRDARELDDMRKFVNEFRPLVGTSPCRPIDMVLMNMWQRLVRARRHRDAAIVADWLRDRGLSPWMAFRRKAAWTIRNRIVAVAPSKVYVIR